MRKDLFIQVFFKKGIFFCLLCVTTLFQVQCSTSEKFLESSNKENETSVKQNIFDDSWLENVNGNMPLVISVPHGGTISPELIKDRDCGTNEMDNNTAQLAAEIENAFNASGKKPFLIIAKLGRNKIDFNRGLKVATCGNPQMEYTWNQYHKYIEEAIDAAINKFGYAMYIDLHGQSHPVKRLELGYFLSSTALKQVQEGTETNSELGDKTSVKNLLVNNNQLTLKELLMGENAFGTLMEKSGFPAVPSLGNPYPKQGEPYFNGGYNTRTYTSSKYPKVFGMQIEANFRGVRDSEENRKKFSKAFTQSVTSYLDFIESKWNY